MKQILYISLFFFLFVSCERYEDFVTYESYLIKKGEHSNTSSPKFKELGQDYLIYDVIFDSTAIYKINDVDQLDINKLYGFSDCNSFHHNNSARFGWRWYNDSLQIFAYTYYNEERRSKYLTSVELDRSYRFKLELESDSYLFSIVNHLPETKMERAKKCDLGIYYLLYPYFGGNIPAPHDIFIHMRRVY